MTSQNCAFLLALVAALAARAQPAEPPQGATGAAVPRDEMLLEGEFHSGGYGGPRVTYGRVAGHDALYLGGEGAWVVNHQYILGGAVNALVTNQPAPGAYVDTHDLTMVYGGGMIGYTLLPRRLVHVTFTTLIGAGGLGRRIRGTDSETGFGDSFFVLEPMITADLNVARFMKAGLALSLRLVRGVEVAGLSNGDLSGLFGSFVLKFGSF